MQVIVIGCGKVGSKFAINLAGEGHDVVIIDKDSNNFKNLGPKFNGVTIAGVPIDQDVLKHAGIETADALAAVTPDDNVNIMACQVAKEIFKVPKVIARIYNPSREHIFHSFGLETICPTDITVDVIKSKVLVENCILVHNIANSEIGFSYEKVSKSNVGKKLGSIKIKDNGLLFGIMRHDNLLLANPELKLETNDRLVIAEKVFDFSSADRDGNMSK